MSYSFRPKNKLQFIDMIKRKMGYPIVPIQIDESQWDFIVMEALNWYGLNVYDGMKEIFFVLDTTGGTLQYSFDDATKWPQGIFTITDVLSTSHTSANIFPSSHGMTQEIIEFYHSLSRFGSGSMVDGSLMFQNLNTFGKLFLPRMAWDFNYNDNILNFKQNPMAQKYGIIASQLIDVEGNGTSNIWNNTWFSRYVIALAKMQWATNLGGLLVGSVTAPGGTSVDVKGLLDAGMTERKELEEEAKDNLSQSYFNVYIG